VSITKSTETPKIEVVNSWNIQVATDTVIKENGKEISRSRHRHYLTPYSSLKGEDGKWTHTDTDISKEASEVQAVANAVWTDTVKANYKTFAESQNTDGI
tara:strand:- start:37 stop:336 length:300 start_codon:yes stop_codon:yes gene_type:complete